MECSVQGKTVSLRGNIRSVADNGTIKEAIRSVSDQHVEIITRDMTVLTSDIIGSLIKLINVDGKKISIKSDSDHMVDLMGRLNLTELIQVQKV